MFFAIHDFSRRQVKLVARMAKSFLPFSLLVAVFSCSVASFLERGGVDAFSVTSLCDANPRRTVSSAWQFPGRSQALSFELFAKHERNDRPIKQMKTKNMKRRRNVVQRPQNIHRPTNGDENSLFSTSHPPILLAGDYEASHHNHKLNRQRLFQDEIACPHFAECSGCSVPARVANVNIIQNSAKLYFTSTAVQRKRMRTFDNYYDDDEDNDRDDSNDLSYPIVVPSPVTGWRTQAKLAVAPPPATSAWTRNAGCVFGLYQRNSHTVMSIPECAVHHPSINRAVRVLEQATRAAGIVAFDEQQAQQQQQPIRGSLRYVQLQVERLTGKVCLTLVWYAEQIKETQPAQSRLVKELQRAGRRSDEDDSSSSPLWHSIWCHCNDSPGNAIFSRNPKRWYLIWGPEFLREPLPVPAIGQEEGTTGALAAAGWLYFTPLTFRQGNLDGFDVLARDVANAVPGGSRVCELYAGVGVLGLTALAHHAREQEQTKSDPLVWLRCSDENPSNPRCFHRAVDSILPEVTGRRLEPRKGGKRSKVDDDDDGMTLAEVAAAMQSGTPPSSKSSAANQRGGDKTSYMVASATQALKSGQALGADILIVDPPRKGLDEGVLVELCKPFNPDQPYTESTSFLMIPDYQVNWTNDVRTLIYVSCGFDALARDAERLLSSNAGWQLKQSTGYVLFPGSDHVETLCIFERA